jgi:hypothetical protein
MPPALVAAPTGTDDAGTRRLGDAPVSQSPAAIAVYIGGDFRPLMLLAALQQLAVRIFPVAIQ